MLCEQQCNAFSNSHRGTGYKRDTAFQAHSVPLFATRVKDRTITDRDHCSTNNPNKLVVTRNLFTLFEDHKNRHLRLPRIDTPLRAVLYKSLV